MAPNSSIYSVINSSCYDVSTKYCSEIIPSLSIPYRKILLNVCQTGCTSGENPRYDKAQAKLIGQIVIHEGREKAISKLDLKSLVETMAYSPVLRSFFSMLLRCETYSCQSGYEEVLKERILNEIQCSQRKKERSTLNYSVFFEWDNPRWYNPTLKPTPRWVSLARNFASNVALALSNVGVMFPKVQRRKNMSRETCMLLAEKGYKRKGVSEKDFTTLDLELHKVETGEEIQGDCELRYAWKFNNLQPRAYYCIGGSQYWPSRYMKRFAIIFMESWIPCKKARRQDPTLLSFDIEDDDFLAIWDMATFTTDLAELKYFLYFVSRYIEDDLRCMQKPLRVVDYAEGVKTVPIHELLDLYNDTINNGAKYHVFRVAEKAMLGDVSEVMEQKNSGMLGVPGNIGFSTCEHAFHAGYATKDPTSGVGIGDDAIGLVKEHPEDKLVPHMNLIGTLEKSKVDIFYPRNEDLDTQVSKFVKRRFTFSEAGLSIDRLPDFPNLAVVFGVKDEFHTVLSQDRTEVIFKFLGQVGSFLWQLQSLDFTDEDCELVVRIFSLCYKKLGLPVHGSLPGYRHHSFRDYIPVCIPPIIFDYSQDWSEVLWERTDSTVCMLPLLTGDVLVPDYFESTRSFKATDSKMLQVLIDLGCVEKIRALKELVRVEESNHRRFQLYMLGRQPQLFQCRYVKPPPEWIQRMTHSDIAYSSEVF